MSLVPQEPLRYLDNIRRDWDRLFSSDFFRGFQHGFSGLNVDIHETTAEVVAVCDIPGLEKKEDVDIDIDRNVLSISGTINRSNDSKNVILHRQERFVGRFHRSITLPVPVSADGVKAAYKNGVLEIRMQKLTSEPKKRIDIEFH